MTSVVTRNYLPVGTNTTLTNLTATQTFDTAATTFTYAGGNVTGSSTDVLPSATRITILAVGPTDGDFRLEVNSVAPSVTIDQTFVRPTDGTTGTIAGSSTLLKNGVRFTYASPSDNGTTYTAYGVWIQQQAGTSFVGGTAAFGVITPAAAVPAAGTATYSGKASGMFIDAGTLNHFSADMISVVDFGPARSVSFTTSNSRRQDPSLLGGPVSDRNLDVGGTMNLAPGTNRFTGTIAGSVPVGQGGYGMTGSANGNFYGPRAQEVGGVFLLSNPANTRLQAGGFAGKCTSGVGACP